MIEPVHRDWSHDVDGAREALRRGADPEPTLYAGGAAEGQERSPSRCPGIQSQACKDVLALSIAWTSFARSFGVCEGPATGTSPTATSWPTRSDASTHTTPNAVKPSEKEEA